MSAVVPSATGAAPASGRWRWGPFEIDLDAGRLERDGALVPLAPRPFSLLVQLVARAGQVVGKDELLDAVWGHRHVTESVLKVAMNAVRAAIGDDPAAPRYVETLARRGYRCRVAPESAAAPRATAADAAPMPRAAGNLPAPGRLLVGREDDAAQLQAMLGRHRLVTLLGSGGVGKTSLALAVAGAAAPPDGVWLVRLDALSDAEPLAAAVAQALSLSSQARRDDEALAIALAPLSLRLVLDNAEHLVEAVAALAARLLAGAPGVGLLVTSQLPLRIAGEQLLPLAPLACPPAAAAAPPADGGERAAWTEYPACRLLVAQVRALQPEFEPTAAVQADLFAICRALDGLPLALELAAARVPVLGLAGVRAHLDSRFALLTHGTRDAAARHRTLRATLDWAWGLLDEPARCALRRLSVLAGAFDAELARAVACARYPAPARALDSFELLDALHALEQQGLLAAEAAGGARTRLRLFDSVRLYARERLAEADEADAAALAHAQVMLARVEAGHAAYLDTPVLEWLARLQPEADDLHAALRFAAAPGAPAPLALALFNAAALFWSRGAMRLEALRWYREVEPHVARADASGRAGFALATAALAGYAQVLAPGAAWPLASTAADDLLALGRRRDASIALYLQQQLAQRLGDPAAARQAAVRLRALEDPASSLLARRLRRWADATLLRAGGDVQAYADFCAAEWALSQREGWRAEAWVCAHGLALAHVALGRVDEAADVLHAALQDIRAAGLLRQHATLAGLHAALRLVRSGDAGARALAYEAAQLLRADAMLWWNCDAWALVAARDARWADVARLRAWGEHVARSQGDAARGPFQACVLEQVDRLVAEAGAAAAVPADADAALNDAQVMALAFGAPQFDRRP